MTKTLRAALALIGLFAPGVAAATPMLTETTWTGIPSIDYVPTDSTITAEQAYTAAHPFTSQQLISLDPSNPYLSAGVGGSTAVDFNGSLIISTSGTYSFYVSADDAARITLAGQVVAEANFTNNGLAVPSFTSMYLAAGSYAFDAFYFQTVGGANFFGEVTYGPDVVSFDPPAAVPEPASLAMLLGAAGLLATLRSRHTRSR